MTVRRLPVAFGPQTYELACRMQESEGEPVLLLHGWGDTQQVYDGAFSHPALATFRLWSCDLLGYGQSDKPSHFSYKLDDQASLLASVVRREFPDGAHIVGHSMGGGIGLLCADMLGTLAKSFISIEGNLVPQDTSNLARAVGSMQPWLFRTVGQRAIAVGLRSSPSPAERAWATGWQQAAPYALQRSAASLAKWSDSAKLLPLFRQLPNRHYIVGANSKDRKKTVVPYLARDDVAIARSAGHTPMRNNPDAFYDLLGRLLRKPR